MGDNPAFMIDQEGCADRDDAVRLVRDTDRAPILEVFIADVTGALDADPHLLPAAIEAGATTYRASRMITPMLPGAVLAGYGLTAGGERAALRIRLHLAAEDVTGSAEIARVSLPDAVALSHEEVTRAVRARADPHHGALSELRVAAEGLFRGRYGAACAFYDFERGILVDEDGKLRRVGASRVIGHLIVQEAMIAANRAMAEWAARLDVPILFRNHVTALAAAPAAENLADLAAALHANEPPILEGWMARTELTRRKARYDPHLRGHAGLAVPAYCHATSPLRRAADLITQCSIVARIEGRAAPYDLEALAPIAERLTAVTAQIKALGDTAQREARHRLAREILESGTDYARQPAGRFTVLVKRATKEGIFSAGFLAEVERRAAADQLMLVDMFHLLFLPQGREWAPAKRACLAQVVRQPQEAISLLAMYAVTFAAPPPQYTDTTMQGKPAVFTATASLTAPGARPVTGAARSAGTRKRAWQQAAVSLIAAMTDLPDPSRHLPVAALLPAHTHLDKQASRARPTLSAPGDPLAELNHAYMIGLLPGLASVCEQSPAGSGAIAFTVFLTTSGGPSGPLEARGTARRKKDAKIAAACVLLERLRPAAAPPESAPDAPGVS